jgi:hypothetical protein
MAYVGSISSRPHEDQSSSTDYDNLDPSNSMLLVAHPEDKTSASIVAATVAHEEDCGDLEARLRLQFEQEAKGIETAAKQAVQAQIVRRDRSILDMVRKRFIDMEPPSYLVRGNSKYSTTLKVLRLVEMLSVVESIPAGEWRRELTGMASRINFRTSHRELYAHYIFQRWGLPPPWLEDSKKHPGFV